MKFLTKLKIVHWVEKQLGLVYAPIPIYKEERQIQTVRAIQLIPAKEIGIVEETQLKFSIGMELLSELQKTSAIKYTIEKDDLPYSEVMKFSAELKYILP
jgi:hypothetical protein